MLTCFLRGLLIGFSIAAPVGPIGVPCIRRAPGEGRAYGSLAAAILVAGVFLGSAA